VVGSERQVLRGKTGVRRSVLPQTLDTIDIVAKLGRHKLASLTLGVLDRNDPGHVGIQNLGRRTVRRDLIRIDPKQVALRHSQHLRRGLKIPERATSGVRPSPHLPQALPRTIRVREPSPIEGRNDWSTTEIVSNSRPLGRTVQNPLTALLLPIPRLA